MTADGEQRMDRQVTAWFEDGPGRAPDGLLGSVLDRTRDAGQRPGWLARAAGAPAVDVPIGRPPLTATTWAALVFAIVALATAVALAGSLILQPRPVVVAPSTSPHASASTTAFATPAPSSSMTVSPPELTLATATDLGFEVAYDPATERPHDPAEGVVFDVSRCDTTFLPFPCTPEQVAFDSAPAKAGVPVTFGGITAVLHGTDLNAIAAQFEDSFGIRPDDRRSVTVPGADAIELIASRGAVVVALHSSRLYAITYRASPQRPFDPGRIDGFLDRFRIIDDIAAVVGAQRDAQNGMRIAMDAAWDATTDTQPRLEIVAATTRNIFGGGNVPTARITVDLDFSDGGLAGLEDSYRTAFFGETLWSATGVSFGKLGTGDLIVGPDRRATAFIQHREYLFTITAYLSPATELTGPTRWAYAEELLRSFAEATSFEPLDAPFTTSWGPFDFSLPTGTIEGASTATAVSFGTGVFGPSWRIDAAKPGDAVSILRAPGSRFDASGKTLDALAASVESVLGLGRDARQSFKLDGVTGYRWLAPQQSTTGPLIALAIVQRNGVQYVFQEHFGLEAPPGNAFDTFLSGISWSN